MRHVSRRCPRETENFFTTLESSIGSIEFHPLRARGHAIDDRSHQLNARAASASRPGGV